MWKVPGRWLRRAQVKTILEAYGRFYGRFKTEGHTLGYISQILRRFYGRFKTKGHTLGYISQILGR